MSITFFETLVTALVITRPPVPEVKVTLLSAAMVRSPARFRAPVAATKSVPALPIFVMMFVLASIVPLRVWAPTVSVD